MTFVSTPIGEAFAKALKTGEMTELSSTRSTMLEFYTQNRISTEAVGQAVAMAQAARQWETVVLLAEAVLAHEDPLDVPSELSRRNAQALIELGAYSGAECVLRRLADAEPEGTFEAREVAGLLGRIAKQRYVSYQNPSQLTKAIKAYAAAYEMPDVDRIWIGGNLLALLHRAERDGRPTPSGVPRLAQVRDAIGDALGQHDPMTLNVWQRATRIELMIARGDDDDALALAETLATAAGAEPFEIAALRRQLFEVWNLPAEHKIMVALSASEMGTGPGSQLDVPAPDSLEKILSSELPVRYDVLVRGLQVAQEVCQIADRFGRARGTGFAIPGSELCTTWSDELVIVTNAHVIPDALPADIAQAVFTKMTNVGRTADHGRPATSPSDPEAPPTVTDLELVWTSPVPELDATVLRFDSSVIPKSGRPIRVAEIVPSLNDTDPYVYVVGHPSGRPLELSIRGNELLDVSDKRLHYMAPTEPGSSGSPVFDQQWDLVGLHHSGSMSMPRLTDPTERYPANEAVNIKAIRNALSSVVDQEAFAGLEASGLTVEITESTAGTTARELQAALEVDAEFLDVVQDDPLEGVDPITIISLVIGGAEMAHRVWKWWRSREGSDIEVTLVRPDGTKVYFNDLSEDELMKLVDLVIRE